MQDHSVQPAGLASTCEAKSGEHFTRSMRGRSLQPTSPICLSSPSLCTSVSGKVTPNGISRLNPLIIGVITYLVSGMINQGGKTYENLLENL